MTFSTHLSGLNTALIGASPRLAKKQDFGLGRWPMSILGFTSATSVKGKWRLSFKNEVIVPPILSFFSLPLPYQQDWDEHFPCTPYWKCGMAQNAVNSRWFLLIYPYVKNQQIFICPSGKSAGGWDIPPGWTRLSYGMGKIAHCGGDWSHYEEIGNSLAEYQQPSQSILVCDSTNDGDGASRWEKIAFSGGGCGAGCNPRTENDARHSGGANIAFVDGHVKWMTAYQIRDAWNVTFFRGRWAGD